MKALDAVGKIWALPNTVIGLLYAGLGHLVGKIAHFRGRQDQVPRISFGNNAIQFENNPLVATALALGNVVIYGTRSRCQPGAPRYGGAHTLGIEEMQHTLQAQVLGPFYLPAHAALGLAASLVNGSWHGPVNVLEAGPHAAEPKAWSRRSGTGLR